MLLLLYHSHYSILIILIIFIVNLLLYPLFSNIILLSFIRIYNISSIIFVMFWSSECECIILCVHSAAPVEDDIAYLFSFLSPFLGSFLSLFFLFSFSFLSLFFSLFILFLFFFFKCFLFSL